MIFLDSSFLVAFAVDEDTNHPRAVEVMQSFANAGYGPPVISDYVFDETATVAFLRTKEIRNARMIGDAMLKAFRILKVNDDVFREAWRMFRRQKGTKYSFTDCTSVTLMEQNDIGIIATFDREFLVHKEFDAIGVTSRPPT
jgi:uncharacterized protein